MAGRSGPPGVPGDGTAPGGLGLTQRGGAAASCRAWPGHRQRYRYRRGSPGRCQPRAAPSGLVPARSPRYGGPGARGSATVSGQHRARPCPGSAQRGPAGTGTGGSSPAVTRRHRGTEAGTPRGGTRARQVPGTSPLPTMGSLGGGSVPTGAHPVLPGAAAEPGAPRDVTARPHGGSGPVPLGAWGHRGDADTAPGAVGTGGPAGAIPVAAPVLAAPQRPRACAAPRAWLSLDLPGCAPEIAAAVSSGRAPPPPPPLPQPSVRPGDGHGDRDGHGEGPVNIPGTPSCRSAAGSPVRGPVLPPPRLGTEPGAPGFGDRGAPGGFVARFWVSSTGGRGTMVGSSLLCPVSTAAGAPGWGLPHGSVSPRPRHPPGLGSLQGAPAEGGFQPCWGGCVAPGAGPEDGNWSPGSSHGTASPPPVCQPPRGARARCPCPVAVLAPAASRWRRGAAGVDLDSSLPPNSPPAP